jgi:hypothetical protein
MIEEGRIPYYNYQPSIGNPQSAIDNLICTLLFKNSFRMALSSLTARGERNFRRVVWKQVNVPTIGI